VLCLFLAVLAFCVYLWKRKLKQLLFG
jgi:hypothetical protein